MGRPEFLRSATWRQMSANDLDWQAYQESRSVRSWMNAAPHSDLTAVALNDLARQSETKPGTLIVLGREKRLKESAQAVGRNPVPVVRHDDAEMVATLANTKRDRPCLRKSIKGIANQI
jgi:hypothetical protein